MYMLVLRILRMTWLSDGCIIIYYRYGCGVWRETNGCFIRPSINQDTVREVYGVRGRGIRSSPVSQM